MTRPQKHLHLNCFSGAGGDMVLSACIDLGADKTAIENELRSLNVGVESLDFRDVMRAGMRGVHLKIDESKTPSSPVSSTEQSHSHRDAHASQNVHYAHIHSHSPKSAHGPHRHLKDMLNIVERSRVGEPTKKRAKQILHLLAEAEGRIHGKPIDRIHFHEISGVDTIVDVLGSCMALEMLGVNSISSSCVTVGRGMVECAHGRFTVPAPATLEILSKARIPIKQGDTKGELLTPTGAALLASMVNKFGSSPAMRPERTGYGAGSNNFDSQPNLLQATLGYCE